MIFHKNILPMVLIMIIMATMMIIVMIVMIIEKNGLFWSDP